MSDECQELRRPQQARPRQLGQVAAPSTTGASGARAGVYRDPRRKTYPSPDRPDGDRRQCQSGSSPQLSARSGPTRRMWLTSDVSPRWWQFPASHLDLLGTLCGRPSSPGLPLLIPRIGI